MKVKLDENIPLRVRPALEALGHDVDTVAGEGLKGSDDPTVWAAAQADARLLVTQDIRVADARSHAPGTHRGILLLRLRDPGRDAVAARVMALFESEDVAAWTGHIVVATERKLRVRRR